MAAMFKLVDAGVEDHHGVLLSDVSVELGSAEAGTVVVPSPLGRNALGLVASGRMVPDAGLVLIDEQEDLAALRRASALVDAPGLTAAEHHMKVKDLVAETLGLQPRSRRHRRPSAAEWLKQHDAADLAGEPVEAIDAQLRLWLLTELAFSDPAVRLAVVESPDRRGLPGTELAETLHGAAGEGRAVLAILSDAPEVPL